MEYAQGWSVSGVAEIRSLIFDRAASGFLWLQTDSALTAWRVRLLLVFRYGFSRRALGFLRLRMRRYPDFIRGDLKIESGWDNWVGYHFLSTNDATDQFLEIFVDEHFPAAKRISESSD